MKENKKTIVDKLEKIDSLWFMDLLMLVPVLIFINSTISIIYFTNAYNIIFGFIIGLPCAGISAHYYTRRLIRGS